MPSDRLRNSTLPRALSDVLADLADLFQKELRLARAELSAKLATRLRAGIWLSTAAVLGLLAGILLVQALVVWITTLGVSLHSSCFMVAAVMAAAGALAYYIGRVDAREVLTPNRTMHQINKDIDTAKEQLT
jgi:hypothetical protein